MNINVFPRLSSKSKLSGTLGLYLETDESAIGINCLPSVFEKVANADNDQRDKSVVLGSICPLNLAGIESLANRICTSSDDISLVAPDQIDGWLQALMIEVDYSNQNLREIAITKYSTAEAVVALEQPQVVVCTDAVNNKFFEYAYHFVVKESNMRFFFAELMDIDAEFPESMQKADLLVLNTARFPGVARGLDNEEFQEKLIKKLADNNVRSAFIPTEDGILLVLPTKVPRHIDVIKDDSYSFSFAGVKATIVHENDFEEYKRASFPLILEPEESDGRVLLGLEKGSTLHQRVNSGGNFDFSTIILAGNSYQKVFGAVDMMSQIGEEGLDVICGRTMGIATSYFYDLFHKHYGAEPNEHARICASDDNFATPHVALDTLEILMIPYPGGSDSYIAQVKDITTGEVLIFTETLDEIEFLEEKINGIYTLVVSVGTLDAKQNAEQTEKLKDMQQKYEIQRLIVLYSGGTVISDLNF